ISLTEFEANYRHIVETITNNSELIILNIPDATKLEIADEVQEQVSQYLIEQYGFAIDAKPLVRQYVGLYNSIIQKIANEYNLTVIDMFNYLDSLSDDLISSDGFHPNEAGHELIADYVKEQMSK
ncbi:SGNH/GDSL hydrolase family protein, partial [Candidatus Woesearchaeota archaeon]|nr:SGNH/GDSL hydrolase family protein [Candidatus Woesearchaeota archaeon]